jgi:CheY-like chemotaxis protein
MLEADPARLQQIFWNLIKNAVKFTPEGGRLHVRTSNDADANFVVCVEDTGLGIDAESLPKIFKAFEQGERPKMGGLGLGLAISKSLVETHNGRITPRAPAADRARHSRRCSRSPTAKPAPARPVQRRRRRNGRRCASSSWKITRIRIAASPSFCAGVAMKSRRPVMSRRACCCGQAEFDVLVSDIGLPDGTGVELMQQLRQADHDIFGIALTGFGMEDDIRRSHDVGFDHHLIKPVDLNKLDALIQQMPVERGRTPAPVS